MAAVACAVISFLIVSAPIKSPVRYLPEPVVPAAITWTLFPTSSSISLIPCFIASKGFPAVGRYRRAITLLSASISTTLVLSDPTSRPR